jgi:hypothetical protein
MKADQSKKFNILKNRWRKNFGHLRHIIKTNFTIKFYL